MIYNATYTFSPNLCYSFREDEMPRILDIPPICPLIFPTLIPKRGRYNMCISSCYNEDSAIIFTTGRLPAVNPP
jgi:hypothetical protein